jgi:hypothetical protein
VIATKPAAKKAAVRRRAIRETPKPKATRRAVGPRIDPSLITLARVPGTPGKGEGPGGEKWRIELDGTRAGEVFINVIDEPPLGRHASIQIFLNAKSQGRGVGRVGYRTACEDSEHDVIYAHMRKSNVASRRAAELAGFVDVTPTGFIQLIMMRKRAR